MNMRAIAAVSAALLLLGSCRQNVEDRHPTIQYVKDILADRDSREMELLGRRQSPRPADDIALIGTFASCDRLAGLFSGYDVRDNVNGSRKSDGLPDFAGETFSIIVQDELYDGVSSSGEEFRRNTVLLSLAAIDTVSHISPYDLDGLGDKRASKMIVLADLPLANYGMFDVDTLFRSAGCDIRVVSPFDLMLGEVFGTHAGSPVRVGILCDQENIAPSMYADRFREVAGRYGVAEASECLIFPTAQRDSLLHRMVDSSMVSGHSRPFDAIVVDDLSLDMDRLKSELADMLSVLNEGSMTYGRMFSQDFRMMDAFGVLADFCYDYMRRQNLFTHNISLPQAVVYRPVPNPGSGNRQIMLISGFYVQD